MSHTLLLIFLLLIFSCVLDLKKIPRTLAVQVSSLYSVKAQLSSYRLVQSWSSAKKEKVLWGQTV